MPQNKTSPTPASPMAFIDAVEHKTRKADALVLDQMFRDITGWQPRMWGPTIIGYGSYHYVYDSGREGDYLATGFSPRKASQSIYVMPGYQDFSEPLSRLGKHKKGAACLYINKLSDIDLNVLREIVTLGLDKLKSNYPVAAT